MIPDFKLWVYEECKKAISFLEKNIKERDIVITHHLPSHRSVHPKWKGSLLNNFFVCNLENLILRKKPAYWIHGHTHEEFFYKIGNTTVICNPLGYRNEACR